MNHPLITIIILNYNGYKDSSHCIRSLLKINYENYKIIIVDNNSTDDSFVKLKEEFPDLLFISSKRNDGYSSGMNIGIKYSLELNAEFVLLLNQDTEVTPDFLNPMLEAFQNKEIGVVSPKVAYFDRRDIIYCGGGEIVKWKCGGVAQFQGLEFDKYCLDDRYITLAEGCCLLVKSEVFRDIGLMDEKFFMYFEDVEFSKRILTKYKIYFAHKSVIFHKSGAGKNWSEFGPNYNYYYTRNRLMFYKNSSFFYRIYVVLFSTANVLLKSVFSYRNKKSLKALWQGYFDGLLYHFNYMKS